MKNYQKIIILLLITITLTACMKPNQQEEKKKGDKEVVEKKDALKIKFTIEKEEYVVTLEESDTTKEFIKQLPLSLTMEDLNHNEKYYYLETDLPTNSYNPDEIKKGDIMLYGKNCLVLFYDTFETDYNYTKIGHINGLKDLDENKTEVIIEKVE